jgi:AbrB family looped-hinge helix DNA binding protein
MPRRKVTYDLTSKGGRGKVREAAVAYIAGRQEDASVSTISSKNQITLPAHLLREMGIGPGDRLAVSREGNRMVLRPRPRDWVKHYGGSMADTYGKSAGQVADYVRELRAEGGRDEAIERAWSGTGTPAQE